MKNCDTHPPTGLEIILAAFDSPAAMTALIHLHKLPPQSAMLFGAGTPISTNPLL
jgi:hypothetical protein